MHRSTQRSVANKDADAGSFAERIAANVATNKAMNRELIMRKRLGSTTSAITPPRSVSKNMGSTVAV